jgi:uncharacterized protein YktB (UPF0637 family)
MSFHGFTQTDFDTFRIQGLEQRMIAIRERIQPKFHAIAKEILDNVKIMVGDDMYLHVARHARRKVNPPNDTWLALCHNKRGYKQHPHFQVGLYDDRVFIWFALIYEVPNKKAIAEKMIKNQNKLFNPIPKDSVISTDHMKKEAALLGDLTKKELTVILERFRDVQQAELLVGKHIRPDDPVLMNGEAFIELVKQTFEQLLPLYRYARM